MDVHAREPVVPDKTPLGAVRDMSLLAVDVLLGEPEIDHVYRLVSRLETDNAISQLDVSVQNPTRVHKL